MNNVMIDLETMGIKTTAPIIAIGACAFDFKTKTIGEKFYKIINLQSTIDNGAIIEADTVLWWLKQSELARAEFSLNGFNIPNVLLEFSLWLSSFGKEVKIWGNGSDFDNVILSASFERQNLPLPWKFWNNRCYRTIKNLYPEIKLERIGTHHNALDDAIYQATHLIKILCHA
jgi:exodeoxyribonuclease VIII